MSPVCLSGGQRLREKVERVFYRLLKGILRPLLHMLCRPWVEGMDKVPREGPAILASNHLSFSDHLFMPLDLSRKVTFVGKSEYFTGTGLKGLFQKAFFRGVGTIPIDRSGGRAGEAALRTAMRVIRRGELFGIYPEGTRSPDGRLYRGKTGVARLAIESGAPVIPCVMINTDRMQPPGRIVPKLGIRPGVRFGDPLDFSRYQGMENDRFVLRAVADEIVYAQMKLSGQEYVDMYAASAKARIAKARKRKNADQNGSSDAGARQDAVGASTDAQR